jgi:hypothetical protein
MKRLVAKTMTKPLTKSAKIGARAFEAITAVEGLALGKESRQRLKRLEADASLTPAQRRDAVLRAYATLSRKK